MDIKDTVACQVMRDEANGLDRRYWRFALDHHTYALILIHYALTQRGNRTRKFVATAEWTIDDRVRRMEKTSTTLKLEDVLWDDQVITKAIEAMRARIKLAVRPAMAKSVKETV